MDQIDLTRPGALTLESVAALLASKDDSQNRQLRVSNQGIAELSDTVGNQNTAGLRFRLETFCAGNGYTGAKAAADPAWVDRIHAALADNWASGARGYIDTF